MRKYLYIAVLSFLAPVASAQVQVDDYNFGEGITLGN